MHHPRNRLIPLLLLASALGLAAVSAAKDERLTAADYARHVRRLKQKVPEGFTILIERPFVVIGDESPAMVKRRAEGTVRWAVDKLKEEYFRKEPAEIIDVWLFKNEASYRKHARAILHETPSTPFGYYSRRHRALVMNIATGGGTLVHEIVHPFVAADFPGCPAWLNEGLGSLYEQCGEVGGRIHGRTNWRLAGLQAAIREKRIKSFEALCSTTDEEFYGPGSGLNYAQARYLCYYLQQHGLLKAYYRQFRAGHRDDPTGYKTLRQVLGRKGEDMAAFQKQWEAFVLELRFP